MTSSLNVHETSTQLKGDGDVNCKKATMRKITLVPVRTVVQQTTGVQTKRLLVPNKLNDFQLSGTKIDDDISDVTDDINMKKVHIEIESDSLITEQGAVLRGTNQSSTEKSGFKCLQCNKTFSMKGNLKVHMKVHEDARPFACTYEGCDKAFKAKDLLKKHTMIHTGVRPWHCEVCNKSFSSKNALKEHESRHTGQKLYKCHQCSAEFRQVSCLSRHLLRHSDETGKYTCTVCGKSFKMSIYLKSHMKSHTGEKPFPCDVCKKSFAHRSDLNRHKIIHTGKKPYECRLCKARFNDSSSRRRHEREHESNKPFACEYCSESFKRTNQLRNHMARKHYIYNEQIIGNAIGTNAEEIIQFPLTADNETTSLLKSVATKLQELPLFLNGQPVTLLSVKNPPDVSDKRSEADTLENLQVDIDETSEFPPIDEEPVTLKTENDDAIENVMETLPVMEPQKAETPKPEVTPVKQEVTSPANLVTPQGIIQRVSLPKINGQTVALDTQLLLNQIKDKVIFNPKEAITISCSVVEDCDSHQIMEVHYHNAQTKNSVKTPPSGESKSQPLLAENTDNLEQNVTLPQSSELPVTSLSSEKGDTVLYLTSEEDLVENSINEEPLLTSEETKLYSRSPDFTSQEYYNWLSAYCEACKSTQVPLSIDTYNTIAKVHHDLINVMAEPKGVLANQENFKILMTICKDFNAIIEKHLAHVLTSLQE